MAMDRDAPYASRRRLAHRGLVQRGMLARSVSCGPHRSVAALLAGSIVATAAFGIVLVRDSSSSRAARRLATRAVEVMGGRAALSRPENGTIESVVQQFLPVCESRRLTFTTDGAESAGIVRHGPDFEQTYVGPRAGWVDSNGIVSTMPKHTLIQQAVVARKVPGSVLLLTLDPHSRLFSRGRRTLYDGASAIYVDLLPRDGSVRGLYFNPTTGELVAESREIHGSLGTEHSLLLTRYWYGCSPGGHACVVRYVQYLDGRLKLIVSLSRQSRVLRQMFRRPVTQTSSAEVSLPISFDSGCPVVAVPVNGRAPLRFIIDTGAIVTTLFPAAWKELGLKPTSYMDAVLGTADERDGVTELGSIRLGDVALRDVVALLVPDAAGNSRAESIAGLLGYDVLGHFQVVVDYPARRLILKPRMAPRIRQCSSDATLDGGHFFVRATARRGSVMAELDTGTTDTFLSAESANCIGAKTAGGTPEWESAPVVSARFSVDGQSILIINTSKNSPLNDRSMAKGDILGSVALHPFRVTLDYARQCVALTRR